MLTMDMELRKIPYQRILSADKRLIKILIIDDNTDFADIMTMIFCHLGYEAFKAYNGCSGLEIARAVKPDVIFCDICLPDISGYEVAAKLRAEIKLADTFLVAISAYSDAETVFACEPNFDRYAAKPIRISVIEDILRTVHKN